MNMTWLSYHIYYQESLNCLLTDCIYPLINQLEQQELSQGFFFLRYWKNGPHLRLRIKYDYANHTEVKDSMELAIQGYLKQHPSKTIIDEQLYQEISRKFARLENEILYEFKLMTNNGLYLEDYEPEFHKYGGFKGVQIAEEIFITSSQLAMHVCVHKKNKFVYAISMMLLAAKAFQMSSDQMQQFFRAYHQYWNIYNNKTYENTNAHIEKITQQNSLQTLLFEVLQGKTGDLLNPWYSVINAAQQKLTRHLDGISMHITDANAQNYPSQYLLTQYIHTNNNRLGVLATEEAFLGYIAAYMVQRFVEEQNNVVIK